MQAKIKIGVEKTVILSFDTVLPPCPLWNYVVLAQPLLLKTSPIYEDFTGSLAFHIASIISNSLSDSLFILILPFFS